MTQNVGSVDKVLRILIGLALVGLSLAGVIGPWGWVGVVPLATALIGWCPAYSLIGVSTRKGA